MSAQPAATRTGMKASPKIWVVGEVRKLDLEGLRMDKPAIRVRVWTAGIPAGKNRQAVVPSGAHSDGAPPVVNSADAPSHHRDRPRAARSAGHARGPSRASSGARDRGPRLRRARAEPGQRAGGV